MRLRKTQAPVKGFLAYFKQDLEDALEKAFKDCWSKSKPSYSDSECSMSLVGFAEDNTCDVMLTIEDGDGGGYYDSAGLKDLVSDLFWCGVPRNQEDRDQLLAIAHDFERQAQRIRNTLEKRKAKKKA